MNIRVPPKVPPKLSGQDVDIHRAKDVWKQTGVDPTDLTLSAESVLTGKQTPQEVDALTTALVRPSGDPTQHAQAMLVATFGETIARRLLDRPQVQARLNKLVDLLRDGPTTQMPEADAKKLQAELGGDAARWFRSAVEQPHMDPAALVKAGTERGLSGQAMAMILKNSGGQAQSFASKQTFAAALQKLEVNETLVGVLKKAGSATYLRDVPVPLLIKDEAVFLESFEVFVGANDRALKLIADMSQNIADALQDGRDITAHTGGRTLSEMSAELKGEVGRMVDWLEATSASTSSKQHDSYGYSYGSSSTSSKAKTALLDTVREKLGTVMDRLDAATENLELVFAHGYGDRGEDFHRELASGVVPAHVAEPYEAFAAICSKSKPQVEPETIETVEELIRVLHREVAHGFGEHVKKVAQGDLVLKKSHSIVEKSPNQNASLSLTYVGNCTPESLGGTRMGAVRDALKGYFQQEGNSHLQISNGVLTDKTMAFDVTLGCHTGRVNVTHDSAHDLYFVEWGMQEPGDGKGRLEFCPDYFRREGFEHNIDGWKHSARKKVTPEDAHKAVWFMLYSLENMRNVDISRPELDQASLHRLFESWYDRTAKGDPTKTTTGREVMDARASHVADAEEIASTRKDWGERERKVLGLMLADPHGFLLAEARALSSSSYGSQKTTVADALTDFLGRHADELFGKKPATEDVLATFNAMATVYFEAVQPRLHAELERDSKTSDKPDSRSRNLDGTREKLRGVMSQGEDDVVEKLGKLAKSAMAGPVFQNTY